MAMASAAAPMSMPLWQPGSVPARPTRTWPTGLFHPSLSCLLATFGCGCIPLFTIAYEAAPFDFVGCQVPKSRCCALIIALLLWFGTVHAVGHTAGIVLLLGWIVLSIVIKTHLGVDENDILTAFKAFLCPPCHVGQIYEGVKVYAGAPPEGGAPHLLPQYYQHVHHKHHAAPPSSPPGMEKMQTRATPPSPIRSKSFSTATEKRPYSGIRY